MSPRPKTPLCTAVVVLAALALGALAAPAAAQMPPTSIARPVDPDSSASSRVVVAVQPIGRVRYDGVTLPVTSPDGRFIAGQHGRTPSWETLLADRGQGVPVGLKISAHRIEVPEPDGAGDASKPSSPRPPARMVPIDWPDPLPPGLLLGRGGDDSGFLVEAPQPDGSRWLGRVGWLTGRVEWIASDARQNAHAAVSPFATGDSDRPAVAFVRRELDSPAFSLVVRSTSREGVHTQSVYTAPDRAQSMVFPFFSPDGRTLATFAINAADPASGPLQLVAFDVSRPEGELRPIARLDLGRAGAGLHSAYQCVAAMQVPMAMPALPASGRGDAARDAFASGLLFFSPRDGAMVWWRPGTEQLVTLARGTFAAVPFQHASFGFLLAGAGQKPAARSGNRGAAASTDALTYQPLRISDQGGLSEPSVGREVEVLAARAIPRTTTRQGGITTLLAAPRSGDADAFDVLLLAPATAP